jgi:putative transposase
MQALDAHRLKSLEDKNGKLKRLLANNTLENVVSKDLLGKRWRHLRDGGTRR